MCIECWSLPDSCSNRESYFTFDNLDAEECQFMSCFLFLLWQSSSRHFDYFLPGGSLLPDSERLGGDSLPSLYISTVSTSSFDPQATLYFLCSIALLILRVTNVAFGAIQGLETNSLFENPSAAALVSNYFVICASNVSSKMYLRRRSHIIFTTTLQTTDRTLLCALSSVLRRASSSIFLTTVTILLRTNCSTGHFTSLVITISFSLLQISMGR